MDERPRPAALLDLRGLVRPMTFFKIKEFMAGVQAGATVEVWLDDPHSVQNVPRSVKAEGHRIRRLERLGAHSRMLVEKGDPDAGSGSGAAGPGP